MLHHLRVLQEEATLRAAQFGKRQLHYNYLLSDKHLYDNTLSHPGNQKSARLNIDHDACDYDVNGHEHSRTKHL
jgi:hypothetical protein